MQHWGCPIVVKTGGLQSQDAKRFSQLLAIFFMQHWGCPIVAKAGGLQSQDAKGAAVVGATASPWQRRIWSPPAFPQGKKDGLK
jgi:hypothetical protein